MRKKLVSVVIIGMIVVLAAFAFVLYNNLNTPIEDSENGATIEGSENGITIEDSENGTTIQDSENGITIELNGLESITITGLLEPIAKNITNSEDIEAICDLFNTTDMTVIEDWNGVLDLVGGEGYLFRFNYSSGVTKQVGYHAGVYLIEDDIAYRIKTREFEKFWELDYPAQKWSFSENSFVESTTEP